MTTTLCQNRRRSECRVCVERLPSLRDWGGEARPCLLELQREFLPHLPYPDWCELDLKLDAWGRLTLLDADTEGMLFRQLNLAYFLADRMRCGESEPGIDLVEFRRLIERGDAIRNTLAVVFHKLVISVASHFVGPHFPLDELASEGHATLLRAIAKFDPDRGFRFSTYATHALRRRLLNYLRDAQRRRTVTLSWTQEHALIDDRRWTAARERRIEQAMNDIEQLARQLTSRERYVLRARFGWGREFEPRTLQQIADEFGISRERVRQLEARALEKLRQFATESGIDGI